MNFVRFVIAVVFERMLLAKRIVEVANALEIILRFVLEMESTLLLLNDDRGIQTLITKEDSFEELVK